MIYLIISVISILTFLVLLFFKNRKIDKSINYKLLNEYISQEKINRKSNVKNTQNELKSAKIQPKTLKTPNNLKKCEITYKPLEVCVLSKKMRHKGQEKITYIERENKERTEFVMSLLKKLEERINSNNQLFRAINNECIIETVASSYAHAILIEENFNIFSKFKELSMLVKVYKKEAAVLGALVMKDLAMIYLELIKDTNKIKSEIFKGERAAVLIKKPSFAKIYGICLLNKSASKLILKYNLDARLATSSVICELDQIGYKQRIIHNYLALLSKATF